MTAYAELDRAELVALQDNLFDRYQVFKTRNLSLDMTRGKPSSEQLDLSIGMMAEDVSKQYVTKQGADCRNSGW